MHDYRPGMMKRKHEAGDDTEDRDHPRVATRKNKEHSEYQQVRQHEEAIN